MRSVDAAIASGRRVVLLHGLGGIGKSQVLRMLAARHPEASIRDDVVEGPDADALRHSMRDGGVWLVAGRDRPSVKWAAAVGADAFFAIEVDGLEREAVADRVAACGAGDPDVWVRASHGHPIVLAGLLAQGVSELSRCPGLVLEIAEILGLRSLRIDDEVLWACAMVRCATEPLLRTVMDAEVSGSLDRLRDVSWASLCAGGISMMPLVRDVVLAEARWRDPARLEAVAARVARALAAKLQPTAEAVEEMVGLVPDLSAVARPVPQGPSRMHVLESVPSEGPLHAPLVALGLRSAQRTLWVEGWDGESASLVAVVLRALGRPDVCALVFSGEEVRVHDLRWGGVANWLAGLVAPGRIEAPELEVMEKPVFEVAVREALRGLARAEFAVASLRFGRSAVAIRHTLDVEPAERSRALQGLLRQTIRDIGDPRARRATERTFAPGAPKQFAIATELGLSFATYRRALAKGTRDVVDRLWASEIGP